jgi:hypothetical protein
MAPTHVYSHPAGTGLGQHHAAGDLAARPAQPPEAAAGLRAAMEMLDPTPEQRAKMEEHLSATMADLDMPDGTPVEHAGTAEDSGHELVAWTDRLGNARVTSVTPEFFASHFREA